MNINPIHNPKFDIITWAGTSFLGGQAQGEYLSITPVNDLADDTLDASGGTGSITMMNDLRADVVLRLDRQSPLNTALIATLNDQYINGGIVVDEISFADSSTLHLYELQGCYIKQYPAETTSTEAGGQFEWTFRCMRALPRQLSDYEFKAEISAKLQADLDINITAKVTI